MPKTKADHLKDDPPPGGVSRATLAAMPMPVAENDVRDHPSVSINGVTYTWAPGEEDTVPPEALAVWNAYLEANR